ncbi:hypothetical protein GCM10011360_17770 [Primorskyibacter flagellatus]|uniref:Terminase small subunit n=1 Tax=Primorskyibacter flagellatus TaxID=1387277 RepID=A0A917A723_9RHOB|nr:hypothetical protein [Primorskyibacter flagellatus]GGE30160.1 hypothetical protein GCM10011360_17770 [Primorskyibacter flagellatus]
MAKPKKSEGQKVREAMDGPTFEHDALIDQIEARAKEEYERGSDAGESAAKTKEFIEKTGMNSQAFSWSKSILKKLPKKDGAHKAMDIIRSLKRAIPMLENHITGQSSEDMFDGKAPEGQGDTEEQPEAAPEPKKGVVTPLDFGGKS